MTIDDFMIKIGKTASGSIIEVPDVVIITLALFVIVSIFAMSVKNKS